MLVTHAGGDELHARPMAVAEIDPDDVLYFATAIDSPKVAELTENPNALVLVQGGNRYACLRGSVRVLQDRALIDRLWSESMKLWFPEGKDDPRLSILAFDAEEGEYWNNSGVNAVKFLFKAAKAYATGTSPTNDESEHGRTRLSGARPSRS
jgi:general stress protein 26